MTDIERLQQDLRDLEEDITDRVQRFVNRHPNVTLQDLMVVGKKGDAGNRSPRLGVDRVAAEVTISPYNHR